jgi:hypothetical protein
LRSFHEKLKKLAQEDYLTCKEDLFGNSLSVNVCHLQTVKTNEDLFKKMMAVACEAIVGVLDMQYKRYYGLDVTDNLKEEAASARSHNMDAESVMGMNKKPQTSPCINFHVR